MNEPIFVLWEMSEQVFSWSVVLLTGATVIFAVVGIMQTMMQRRSMKFQEKCFLLEKRSACFKELMQLIIDEFGDEHEYETLRMWTMYENLTMTKLFFGKDTDDFFNDVGALYIEYVRTPAEDEFMRNELREKLIDKVTSAHDIVHKYLYAATD